jgi:opacity protein-like surface antigen
MSRLVLFFFAFLFLSSRSLLGQVVDCEQTLNTASAEYDAGRFYGLPAILKECLANGFSKEQKVRAYLLLTQAYLILDEPKSAEKSYLELLRADPEYIANPERTPIEVYYLSKKFTSTPVFTPNFRLGLNTSIPRTIFSTVTSSVPDKYSSKDGLKLGYQLGADMDLNLTQRFSIGFGLAYSRKTFSTNQSDNNGGSTSSFIEREDWFDIPLYLKYAKDSGKIRPFVYAGVAANFLVRAKLASPNMVDLNAPIPKTQQVSAGQDEPITDKRNLFNRSIVFGGGVKYKIGKDFLFVDARYMMGLSNVAKNNYTLADGTFDPILARYGYSSDFFRLDNVSLSFGYIKPLYNPRKKKNGVSWVLRKLGLKRSNK